MGQLDQSFMASPYNTIEGPAIDEMFLKYPDFKAKDRTTILCILASCWDAYRINEKNDVWVSLSFNNGHYTAYPDYSVKHWTRSRVKSSFQYLRDNKLINKLSSIAPRGRFAGKRTRVKISNSLLELFTSHEVEPAKVKLDKPHVLIRTKLEGATTKSNLVKPPITSKHYIKIVKDVSVINEELLKHQFGLPSSIKEAGPPLQGQKSHYPICFNELFDNNLRIRLQRLFSSADLKKHGRYYTTLQSLSKKVRPYLTIDGEGTVELDYAGLHYNIAYNKNGLEMLEYPYQHPDIPPDLFKTACIIALNTKNKGAASGAIRKTIDNPPDGVNWAGMSAKAVLQAVIDKHLAIKDKMFQEYGLYFMNIDSDIATDVIRHFTKLGEGILPLHDSFVVRSAMHQELVKVMNESYKNHLNFEPYCVEVKNAA